MARRLILFTSLPKVGGHSTLTEGLCRLLRPSFDDIEIWCKPMPEHGHSRPMAAKLQESGCGLHMLAAEDGTARPLAISKAILRARQHRGETVFFALAMRHLSVCFALALQPRKSVYYHITHDLNPATVRRLKIYSRVFQRMVFICPATYHQFPGAESMPNFAWAPQASDMNVPDPSEILECKAARSQGPLRIGLLGRLTAEKGARIMLDFIDNASASCEFHVAGNGPLAEEFSKRSEGIAPSPARVVFHGAYDPAQRAEFLRRFFTGIDLLVVPSQDEWETLSMVTLEALQHGTPSLLCRTGGLISFGLPDLGPAPESVVGLVDPHHFKAELARRIAAPRPDPIANGEACIRYYAAHFRDAVIQQRWSDLLAG